MNSDSSEPAAPPLQAPQGELEYRSDDADPLQLCNLAWDATAAAVEAVERDDMEKAISLLDERGLLIAAVGQWTESTAAQAAPAATREAVREWVRRLQEGDGTLGTALQEAVEAARRERSDLATGRNALGGYGSSARARPEAEFIDRRR